MKSWLVAHHMTLMTDRRYAALDRSRVGDRNFLRLQPAVSAKDIIVDRRSVDFPLQQNRCRHCGNAARCSDLGNAGTLCRRIPVRLLDTESSSGAAGTLSPVSTARLRALACIFTGYLAYLLARLCRIPLPIGSLGDHYLFSHAVADQPRQGDADKSVKMERIVLNALAMESARPRAVRCEAARGRAGSSVLPSIAFFSPR